MNIVEGPPGLQFSPVGTLKVGGCVTAPVVPVVSPPDGATGVSRSAHVVAVFDRPMDAASVAPAFTLVRTATGRRVPGVVGLGFGDRVAVFTPSRPLRRLRTFAATISTAATAQDGQALAAARTWSFTTGAR